jgi:hypothetical protein
MRSEMEPEPFQPGVGPTSELNLRVSVAVLARVIFESPESGNTMIALERTATLIRNRNHTVVEVKARPFGGGVRILRPLELSKLIGGFNYDSERSLELNDFRIQIHPDQWENVKEICLSHQASAEGVLFDTNPLRELTEEFRDSLGLTLTGSDYDATPLGMVVEESPKLTGNVYARGLPTVRIYYIYKVLLWNREMIETIISNSRNCSDRDLVRMAREEARQGGKGRANAVLVFPLGELEEFYRTPGPRNHAVPLKFRGHRLEWNIPIIL